jgi:leader peptidase (prepilin peptidase) / N-methyltransferase
MPVTDCPLVRNQWAIVMKDDTMFPDWTWIVGLMIGATIGSFLNVVIYRMPRNMSLGEPKNSFCPLCKNRLGIADLIPLFSWLTSKGRCRHCLEPIPARYFWVELTNGVLWAAIWWKFFCAEPTGKDWAMGCFFAVATAALVAIIFIDWEHYIIPDEINAFLLVLGLGFHAYNGSLREALFGYLVGWGIIFGIAFLGRVAFGKDAMGHGDIKMMRGVGALLGGWLTVVDVGIAVVTGLVFGIFFIVLDGMRRKKAGLPLEDPETEDDEQYQPESIKDLMVLGISYLLCFDVIAIWKPQIYTKMGYPMEDISVDDDDWEPSLTTIPFGPYLAVGALVCMIFHSEIFRTVNERVALLFGTS